MADERISEVAEKATLHDTDLVPIVDIEAAPDETKHITGANLKSEVRRIPATYVVAANDSENKQADYICNGTDDHVQIQDALDALPATGGKVLLLDGTYYIESSIVLDSYQTLQGMGRSTILTTTTADLDIITATGGSGTEKTGILLADFCVDGNAGAVTNDYGIKWTYVDNSKISGVYSLDNGDDGIYLENCDYCNITDNTCLGNTENINIYLCTNVKVIGNTCNDSPWDAGIYANDSDHCSIIGNTCKGNADSGIYIINVTGSSFFGNTCSYNWKGIYLSGGNSGTVIGSNTCVLNDIHGIYVCDSSDAIISANSCTENSQNTTNTYDDIFLDNDSNYNFIIGNICRAGAQANKPRYGINVSDVLCDSNKIINNDLYDDGFGTAPYNDSGTGTIYVELGIDDTPVNGETGQPISSNWAFDHNAATTGVHGAGVNTILHSGSTDVIGGAQLTQVFGASAGRLRNIFVTPISGEALRIANCSGSCFDGVINGAPTSTSVVYDGESEENMFNGLSAYDGSAFWGQIILHNTTRGNSRKIVSVNTVTNTITTTSSTDNWADNDVITTESQTNEGSSFVEYFDIDISGYVGTGVDAVVLMVVFQNNTASANANNMLSLHPFETYGQGKRQWCKCAVANECTNVFLIMPVISQKITLTVYTTGVDDFYVILSVVGKVEFADT